jgi:hypothetical protein
VNRESAYELLNRRAAEPAFAEATQAAPDRTVPRVERHVETAPERSGAGGLNEMLWGNKRRQGMVETMAKQAARTVGSQLGRQILRGVLGGIMGGSRRR